VCTTGRDGGDSERRDTKLKSSGFVLRFSGSASSISGSVKIKISTR
jgi:hypothetical protein